MASPATDNPVIVLLGNYPLDRQESMLRFRDLVHDGLRARGYDVESVSPHPRFAHLFRGSLGAKWIGYFDKYVLFPGHLRRVLAGLGTKYPGRKIITHICDHSNAVYTSVAKNFGPVLVTCHDLLAVRGALGEDTDCPASSLGKKLQAAILRGLCEADSVACVSHATRSDLIRLGSAGVDKRSEVIPLSLNYSYEPLPREDAIARLSHKHLDLDYRDYVLHVGSSLRRKNREALLRAVALIKDKWHGNIVFAGEPLLPRERELAHLLGIDARVVETRPDNETLRALYAAAHAFIFMSRFEGFGWPVLEAQGAGCPVICSNRTSVPEIAGEGALVHEPEDYAAVAADIQRLQDSTFRDNVVAKGFANVATYTGERMMNSYEEAYNRIGRIA